MAIASPKSSKPRDRARNNPTERPAGRPRVDAYKPRKQRGVTRRLLPRFVDMGALSTERFVRYDEDLHLYDVRDMVELAYDSVDAASRVLHELRKEGFLDIERTQMWLVDHGLEHYDFGRLKWADAPSNRGRARELASARACAQMLSSTAGPRPPHALWPLIGWFLEASPTTVAFLEATPADAAQRANVHLRAEEPQGVPLPDGPEDLAELEDADERVPEAEEPMSEVDSESEGALPDEVEV